MEWVCGICGVVQLSGEPAEVVSQEVLEHMTNVMRHRGPDDIGTYTAPGIALGVRRLSIVDVREGHQPFANEDESIWAVQNGELYEHRALRTRLASDGHVFASRCDTEIIPHLYEAFGTDFPTQLRGMFGIALWDGGRRRAVLARDRVGIKPLYYSAQKNALVFASELKSLLASGLVEVELDYAAIDAYLTLGYFPTPLTPLRHVHKLLAGHTLVVENGAVEHHPYWSYPTPTPTRGVSFDEHSQRLLAKLDESVQLRLMSDVPLGAMLSGGLDSSMIVALMARHMSEPVKTFSVGFAGAGEANELADARMVSQYLGTDHHELELSVDDPIDLEDLCWHMDEPLADLSALGFRALCELAARHVTVALSGQGADELLAGYRKHRAAALSGAFGRTTLGIGPRATRAIARRTRRGGAAAAALAARDPVERLLASSALLTAHDRDGLVRGPLEGVNGTAAAILRDRLGAIRADAARVGALPRRATWAGRRHAPLLRPRVDGSLPGSSCPLSRPSARRAVRDHPLRVQTPSAAPHEARPQSRSGRARSRSRHRQAEGRLLQSLGRGLAPRPDRRGRGRVSPRPGSSRARVRRPGRAPAADKDAHARQRDLRVARPADARGLAPNVLAPRDRRPRSCVRARYLLPPRPPRAARSQLDSTETESRGLPAHRVVSTISEVFGPPTVGGRSKYRQNRPKEWWGR